MAQPHPRDTRNPARKLTTRDRLLDAAGELLAEVGMERISTNLICERAGVTPPALYHYFADKFEVVVALGERLMDRQNAALIKWIDRHASSANFGANIIELMRETAEITEAEPGGVWIERALHSSPRLEHVRIESHRHVTDLLTDAYTPWLPNLPRSSIWRRVRMLVEIGYVTVELLHAESSLDGEAILAETARLQELALQDLANSP